MVWYSLKVGDSVVRIKRLEAEKPKFLDVDENGNSVKRICRQKGIYEWVDNNDKVVNQRYKMINNKPMASLTRTKETDRFKEVDSKEAFDLIAEMTFYVEGSQALLNKLQAENKALKFGYTTSGFEGGFYKAYIVVDNGDLIMICGNAYKSLEIANAKKETSAKRTAKPINNVGIERAKVEDLIEI